MSHEKMTDERLRDVLSVIGCEWPLEAHEIRAHIAALTAERDLASTRRDELGRVVLRQEEESRALHREAVALREQLRFVNSEHESFLSRLHEALGTNDGGTGADIVKAAEELRGRAEGKERLRERIGELEDALTTERAARKVAERGRQQYGDILRAIRQRAGDGRALVDVYRRTDVMGLEGALVEVCRHVIGDDEQPPQTDDLDAVEQWRENQEAKGSNGEHKPGTNPATSTAEAFATVRDIATRLGDGLYPSLVAQALASISMLEHRMGGMWAALAPFVAYAKAWGANPKDLDNPHTSGGMVLLRGSGAGVVAEVTVDDFRRAVAALTDAPSVFTLEEVKTALTECIGDMPDAVREVVERLTNLRRVS